MNVVSCAVKEKQGKLHANLKDLFAGCLAENFKQVPHGYHHTVNKRHGSIEFRESLTQSNPEYLDYLRQRHQWRGLQTVMMIRAEVGSMRNPALPFAATFQDWKKCPPTAHQRAEAPGHLEQLALGLEDRRSRR